MCYCGSAEATKQHRKGLQVLLHHCHHSVALVLLHPTVVCLTRTSCLTGAVLRAWHDKTIVSTALQDKADAMVAHLASLSKEKVILSFAPKTPFYSVLKRIGELFPGPSKATRAYLHREEDVEAALQAAGFKVVKKDMTATQFYFSRLFEAVRV
jgi:hypothetical protein